MLSAEFLKAFLAYIISVQTFVFICPYENLVQIIEI